MERTLRANAADVGRRWGWVLAFGIVTLLAGILALMWSGRTVVVPAVLFGAQLEVFLAFRLRSVGQRAARTATATAT